MKPELSNVLVMALSQSKLISPLNQKVLYFTVGVGLQTSPGNPVNEEHYSLAFWNGGIFFGGGKPVVPQAGPISPLSWVNTEPILNVCRRASLIFIQNISPTKLSQNVLKEIMSSQSY